MYHWSLAKEARNNWMDVLADKNGCVKCTHVVECHCAPHPLSVYFVSQSYLLLFVNLSPSASIQPFLNLMFLHKHSLMLSYLALYKHHGWVKLCLCLKVNCIMVLSCNLITMHLKTSTNASIVQKYYWQPYMLRENSLYHSIQLQMVRILIMNCLVFWAHCKKWRILMKSQVYNSIFSPIFGYKYN